MDREKAIREFDAYVSRYHAEDPMIRLKILHTYRHMKNPSPCIAHR